MALLEMILLGNSLSTWLLAAGVMAACILVLPLLKRYAVRRLRRVAARTATAADDLMVDIIDGTRMITFVLTGVFAGISVLELPGGAPAVVRQGLLLVLILQGAFWGGAVISFYQRKSAESRPDQDPATVTAMRALTRAARVALWGLAGLLLLDNLGVNITGLVAGLGIGGLAVALALQNVLGDLFASLTILLDKPFVVGDFIVVDSYLGAVEHIGLKTTRLRSLSGEQVVMSNADLLGSRIRNYRRMQERRVILRIDLTYQTTQPAMVRAIEIVRHCIQEQDRTRFDRAHFMEFAPSSLRVEAVYYILDPEYNTFMDIQQAVNLAILGRFTAEGLEFAFPTTTVHLRDSFSTPWTATEATS